MEGRPLLAGHADLLAALYSRDGYLRRCEAVLRTAPPPPAHRRARKGGLAIVARTVWKLGIVGRDRRAFWRLLWRALRRSPRYISWAISHALQGEHLVRYTREHVLPGLAEAVAELAAGATA